MGCVLWLIKTESLLLQNNRSEKRNVLQEENWVLCPICGSKTRIKIRQDSILEKFPLFCPKCKKELLVNIKQFEVTVIKEPDAQTQSR